MSSDHTTPTTDGDQLLLVRNLTKHFDTGDSLLDRLFGDTSAPVRAVDGIDFEIERGETFGLVGESGCGKSTTGETVLQLLEPTGGTVVYDGLDLTETDNLGDFRRRTGVVFQDPYSSLDPRMTIGEIIRQPLDIHGWPWPDDDVTFDLELTDAAGVDPQVDIAGDVHRVDGVDPVDGVVTIRLTTERVSGRRDSMDAPETAVIDPHDDEGIVRVRDGAVRVATPHELRLTVTGGDDLHVKVAVGRSDKVLRRERAARFLERVGLSADQLDRYPHEFSGGQRQRIGIARALVLDPDFLVLDEPTSALDVSVQAQVLNLLMDLREEFDLTYLIISHDLSVIRHICDRVAVMYLGELVEIAPADELFESPEHPYTKALLESVPRPEVNERERDVRPLSGDVPSPRNPPSGCRFRTRCPRVIPPDGLDLTQEEYRAVMDIRERIENRAITLDDEVEDDELPTVETMLDRLIEVELPTEHDDRIRDALEKVAEDEFTEAAELLEEPYVSVCEQLNPDLVGGAHRVACHLRHPPER